MRLNGVKPYQHTFSIIMNAFAKKGDIATMYQFFEMMLDHGIYPGSN